MSTLGTLAVKLKADTTRLVKNLDNASKSLKGISEQARKTGLAMTAIGAVGSIAGLKAIKIFGDFEESITKVGAVSRTLGTKTFKQLEAKALQMGRVTRFTATQSADAMKNMAMAGLDAKDIIAGIPHVLNLASASTTDLASTADILTNIMSGFGKGAGELGSVNDILTNTFTRANVDLIQLGESFKMVGPIANAAGMSLNETAAAIGMIGNVGIKGTMAGVSIKEGISSILAPTGEAREVLKALEIQVIRNADGSLNFGKTLEQFAPIANDAGLMLRVFGRAAAGMQGIITQGVDKLEQLTNATSEQGASSKIATAMNNTFKGQMDLTKSAIDGFAMSIGQSLVPIIRGLNGVLNGLLSVFNSLSFESKKTIANFLAISSASLVFGGALLFALGSLQKIGKGLLFILKPLGLIKYAFSKLAFVIGGVVLLGASLYELYKFYANDIGSTWNNLANNISQWFNELVDNIIVIGKNILSVFQSAANNIKDVFISGIADMLGVSESDIISWGDSIYGLFSNIVNDLMTPIKWLGGQIKDILTTAFEFWINKLPGWLKTALNFWSKKFGEFEDSVTGKITVSGGVFDKAKDAYKKGKYGSSSTTKTNTPGDIPPIEPDKGIGKFGVTKAKDLKSLESFIKAMSEFEDIAGDSFENIASGVEDRKKQEEQQRKEYFSGKATEAVGSLGKTGGAINAAMQGMSAGGPMGAALGVGMSMLTETEAFKDIVGYLNTVFADLVVYLEPLVEAVQPLVVVFGELLQLFMLSLQPVLTILAELIRGPVFSVLKIVARVIAAVFTALGNVWNFIIDKLAWILKKIPKWGKDLAKGIQKYKFDTEGMKDILNNFENMTTESAKKQIKSANELADTTKKLNEELTNVPSGLKVTLRRFQSMDPKMLDTKNTIENITVNAANPSEFWGEVKKVMNNDNFTNSGSTVMGTSQYGVPGIGSTSAK